MPEKIGDFILVSDSEDKKVKVTDLIKFLDFCKSEMNEISLLELQEAWDGIGDFQDNTKPRWPEIWSLIFHVKDDEPTVLASFETEHLAKEYKKYEESRNILSKSKFYIRKNRLQKY